MLIEPIVLSYLQSKLDMTEVYMEIPTNHPETFVTLRVVDENQRNLINAATFEIHSYAPTKYEAMLLNEKVREAMNEIIILGTISSSKLSGGGDAPDTSTKSYRYKSYYNLVF